MRSEGPPLEHLLRRLAECQPEFLQVEGAGELSIEVVAVLCDVLRRQTPNFPPELDWPAIRSVPAWGAARQAVASLAAYLLSDDWFNARPDFGSAMRRLFESQELAQLATLVKPARLVNDADRREEFVRICLRGLELRPAGESETDARDRLTSLDSAERERVLRATAAAERRAREIREAMARKQAAEASSRYGE